MTDDNKIQQPFRAGFKAVGLQARAIANANKPDALVRITELPNRLVLVMDDSGSMSGDRLVQAKKGIDEFLRCTNSRDTAIALYPLNATARPLSTDFTLIGFTKESITATGGTPLYTVLKSAIEKEAMTRAIVFSDGSPTDSWYFYPDGNEAETMRKDIIELYVEKKIPIDTIGIGESASFTVLEDMSKRTNGIFMRFTDAKTLASSLKYLAPAFRAMLANPEIKERIEKGEQI